MTKLSEVSGPISPGSCCTPQMTTKSATASRRTPSSCGTSLCKLPTRLLATPFIRPSFCICHCFRTSVAFFNRYYFEFSICMLGTECLCYVYMLPVRFYSQNGIGWQCQASTVRNLHRTGASQNLHQAGRLELFPRCWNVRGAVACMADEPGHAEIPFSSLEKSSKILIINYFWCIIYFFFFFLGQVTCADRLQLSLVPAAAELVSEVYVGLFI